MIRTVLAALFIVISNICVASDLVKKTSAHSVAATLDNLSRIVTEKGFKVIARVNHAAAAEAAELELRDTELLIFGNPKVGTQLMQSQQSIGLDLPIRVVAWQAADGQVWIAYNDPGSLLTRHSIDDREPIKNKMTMALQTLTDAAVK